jgi:hypothetical protein
MASQQRRWLPKPDTNGYSDANSHSDTYAYSYSDANVNGNGNAYSDVIAYSNGNAYGYRGAEDFAYAKATAHPTATSLSSKISWLDSGTRERKLASFCLWTERTVLL